MNKQEIKTKRAAQEDNPQEQRQDSIVTKFGNTKVTQTKDYCLIEFNNLETIDIKKILIPNAQVSVQEEHLLVIDHIEHKKFTPHDSKGSREASGPSVKRPY